MAGLELAAEAAKTSVVEVNPSNVQQATELTADLLKPGTPINSLSVGDLIKDACGARIEQPVKVGTTSLTDALIEAGLVDPKLIESPMATDLHLEQRAVGQRLETDSIKNTGELTVRETPREVQICDSNGNVCATISPDEYAILKEAGLSPQLVNGRVCFIRGDIDLNFKDALGSTNLERMKEGLAPLDANTGRPIELHHVGQVPDGPLAELRMEEHRTAPNNLTLHPVREGSEVEHGVEWDQQRADHWKSRAETMEVLS